MNQRKLSNWLKKIKYRHWMGVLIVILIYAVWKAYVLQTPSPHDDNIPDKVRDSILLMVYDDDNDDQLDDLCEVSRA